ADPARFPGYHSSCHRSTRMLLRPPMCQGGRHILVSRYNLMCRRRRRRLRHCPYSPAQGGTPMIKPGDFLAVVARAELRTASGDWPEAAALWAQVTAENPVNGDYWARLAEAQFARQEYTAAHQAYEKV